MTRRGSMLTVVLVLCALAVIGAVATTLGVRAATLEAEREELERRAGRVAASSAPGLEAASPESPTTPSALPVALDQLDYTIWRQLSRDACMQPMDRGPETWTPGDDVDEIKLPGKFRFSAADIPRPSDDDILAWRSDTPLVRRMPYPYFSALTIPSDCCGSRTGDLYYMQSSLSRDYGLDMPSSFFPFNSGTGPTATGYTPALFTTLSDEPLVAPVTIEGAAVDALPFYLTSFYRGWIDHVHNWSTEYAPFHSLLESVTATVATGAVTVDIAPLPVSAVTFQGFELSIRLDGPVDGFELRFVDELGIEHAIVHNAELGDRPGWDVSGRAPAELERCFLHLDEERNRPDRRALGRATLDGDPTVIRSATLTVTGAPGAACELVRLRAFDLTRDMVRRQMQVMSRYNLLPNTLTQHGGNSSWTAVFDGGPYSVEVGERTIELERPPMGIDPSTPSYLADLLTEFGIHHFNTLGMFTAASNKQVTTIVTPAEAPDGTRYYESRRGYYPLDDFKAVPQNCEHVVWGENLGAHIARFLAAGTYGENGMAYHHFNLHCPATFKDTENFIHTEDMRKQHPFTDAALRLLSDLKYDLDSERAPHERVWTVPVSVNLRYAQAVARLAEQATLDGNTVRIEPWADHVTGAAFPDPAYLTQDLHGQTFYVPNATTARVVAGEREITSLKRNAPDFTGRASVTVVDTHAPTIVFDEVDLYERAGVVVQDGGSYFFQRRNAYRGEYAMEIQAERDGRAVVAWEPFLLESHETDFLRFAYQKTNPETQMELEFTIDGGTPIVVTEGALKGRSGWTIPHRRDRTYHEVVVDYADQTGPEHGRKTIPRGRVQSISFGIDGARSGDSVMFDRVEFLGARGVRPEAGRGVVVGGRLTPHVDHHPVTIRYDRTERTVHTRRGGWYIFDGVPRDAVVELTVDHQGTTRWPVRGRLAQAGRNDLEYHFVLTDPRSVAAPRPAIADSGLKVPATLVPRSVSEEQATGAPYRPHSARFYAGYPEWDLQYMVEDQVNNFGFIDKDRRYENLDDSFRVVLLGECWTEGGQTPTSEHYNVILESILRRRMDRNVEVITHSTSNGTPGTNSIVFEQYAQRFKPDVVVLMSDIFPILSIDGEIQKRFVGWDGAHAPYRMFDFDEGGHLVEYPPDPQFGAFATAPALDPLLGSVPLMRSHAVVEGTIDRAERNLQLLDAILREKYLPHLEAQGGALCMAFGYDKPNYMSYGLQWGDHHTAEERFFHRMQELCARRGVHAFNLAPDLFSHDYAGQLIWARDQHLTSVGHDVMARVLAERILALPRTERGQVRAMSGRVE